jgi:hypothetical protein
MSPSSGPRIIQERKSMNQIASNGLQGVISKNMGLFTTTALRASNPE